MKNLQSILIFFIISTIIIALFITYIFVQNSEILSENILFLNILASVIFLLLIIQCFGFYFLLIKPFNKTIKNFKKVSAINKLPSKIAHDLNNNFNIIMGCTSSIKNSLPTSFNKYNKFEIIEKTINKTHILIEQLFFINDLINKKLQPIPKKEINPQIIKFLKSSLSENISWADKIVGDIFLLADYSHYQKIVNFLSKNELKSMKISNERYLTLPENKEIYITISKKFKNFSFLKQILDKILDYDFANSQFQEDKRYSFAVIKGSGENLIRDDHQTEMKKKSMNFELFFPILENETKEESIKFSPSIQKENTILFIDDDKDLTELFSDSFSDFGFNVIAINDSSLAYKAFIDNKSNIDLIISDTTMPKISGLEVIEKIRKIDENIPIILFSGYKSPRMISKAKTLDIAKIVIKPIFPEKMITIVKEILK
ncbi:MAG: response regulator [Candidatus Cloacimonetes bacterium]|nr:response regulator [Candidatus Cloacimonadota bacterium]